MKRIGLAEVGLGVGILAALLLVTIGMEEARLASEAWFAAWLFWIGMPVGALFLLLAHGLTGGRWGLLLQPALADLVGTLPLLTLLFVPILLGVWQIYPWARVGTGGWLAPPFFLARAVLYMALWNLIAVMVRRERGSDGGLRPALAWPALIVLFLTASLAAFDWVMTLEPYWTSTIFGLLLTAGWVLSALALALLLTLWRAAVGEALDLDMLARLLLALTMLWAYLSAIQLIVIWESDLASEIVWLLRRTVRGWLEIGLLYPAFEFCAPFLLLLSKPRRCSRAALATAACAILTAHVLETWWLTVPDFLRPPNWLDLAAIVAVTGGALFNIDHGPGMGWLLPRLRSGHERS